MNYMLLLWYIFFYKWMINNKIKCGNNESEKNEEGIDSSGFYNEESTYIVLDNNSLSSLSSKISKFQKLTSLFLKHNNFTTIPSILSEIKTLKLLNMDKNRLNNFPTGVILENLKDLYLKNNEIIFTKSSNSEDSILNLDENYPNLEILNLSQNQIEYMPRLQSRSLEKLYLDQNKIINIHSKMFIGLTKLKSLTLTSNKLTDINNDIGELKNFEIIDLSGNKIKTFILDKDCLENFKSLNLEYNQIKEFKLEQSIVPKITMLSLMYNELSTIPSDIYNLKSLEGLNISCNNITEIDNSIENLKNLKILYIHENKIFKIPESITKLTKLKIFRISFEPLRYVPDCVITIIKDINYYDTTYEEFIKSQRINSGTEEDSPRRGQKRKRNESIHVKCKRMK